MSFTEADVDPRVLEALATEAERREYNTKLLRAELITPDRLYLDLEILRDLRLGTIITFLAERSREQAEADYAHLLSRLEAYSARTFSDVAHNFPELGLCEADIDQRLHDPAWHGRILTAAPATTFAERTLAAHLSININHSAVAEKIEVGPDGKRYSKPIRIVLNTWPLTNLTRAQFDQIGEYLVRRFGIELEILTRNPQEMEVRLWESFDEIYTADLQTVLKNKALSATLSTMALFNRRLFAAKVIRGTFDPKRNPEAEFIAAYGGVIPLIQFTYIPPELMAPLSNSQAA